MGTLRSVYIRLEDSADLLRIRDRFQDGIAVTTEDANPFAEIAWDDFHVPAELMECLSRDFHTDVLWLVFQSAVDAFAFQHWHDGSCGRHLVFGCFSDERTWERIVGDPEPWEKDAFDSPSLGRFDANVDGRETARAVAEFHGLPGWS